MEELVVILQKPEIAPALIGALIGGALSLLGAFGALMLSNKLEKKSRTEETKRLQSERAYSAFSKLLYTYNTAANIKKQIDEMFESADASGDQDMEPWAKVMEVVRGDYRDEALKTDETSFLIAVENASLLNDVHEIQLRVWDIEASVKKYNEVREEFHQFLENNHEELEPKEGTQYSAALEGTAAKLAQMRTGRLNNLLGQIMEALEKDVEEAWRVANEFRKIAECYFGTDFPKFQLEKAHPNALH